jgi:hypothetical protein
MLKMLVMLPRDLLKTLLNKFQTKHAKLKKTLRMLPEMPNVKQSRLLTKFQIKLKKSKKM